MEIAHARMDGKPSEQRGETFTGVVYADPVLATGDGVTVNTVTFTPCARTYWHHHERGQLLVVLSGRGVVANRDGDFKVLQGSDIVWVPAGEQHWHGGSATTMLIHNAVSHGKTTWLEEVPEADYRAVVESILS